MKLRTLIAVLALSMLAGMANAAEQWALTGDVRIHDPSVIEMWGGWVAFETGRQGRGRGAIELKTSPDGRNWTSAGSLGKGVPKWARGELGFSPPNVWAPSITRHDNTYYLYYSLSVFGINTSAIGLMTNAGLDPMLPAEGWIDQGPVLKSGIRDDWNAIDPRRIDTPDGRAWLSYGSYWNGIKLRELDPVSGMTLGHETYDLASRGGAGIEASAIFEHERRFYLFVSFDQCCRALDSTYKIMVGRADAVTGPYFDRDGRPMMDGAATEVLSGQGRFIGPGGQEVISSTQGDLLVYHYYDGDERGISKLAIAPIEWDAEGWPVLPAQPQLGVE